METLFYFLDNTKKCNNIDLISSIDNSIKNAIIESKEEYEIDTPDDIHIIHTLIERCILKFKESNSINEKIYYLKYLNSLKQKLVVI